MKFSCPYCRRELDLAEMLHEGDLRAIIAMSDTFGRHRALVWAYADLFGVTPLRAKSRKLRLILEEVRTLFQAEEFSFQKRRYRISQAGIAEALGVVARRNFAGGLDSHNYLKKIMIGIAEREAQAAGRAAEKDIRAKEARLQSGSRDKNLPEWMGIQAPDDSGDYAPYPIPEEQVEPPPMKTIPPARRLTPEQIEANRQRLKRMVKEIGG